MRVRKMRMRVEYELPRCWVGDRQKVCYACEEDALVAARAAEYAHGLRAGTLVVYLCEYGGHWHLAGGAN